MRPFLSALIAVAALAVAAPASAQTWSGPDNTGFLFESNAANGKVFGGHFKFDDLSGEPTFSIIDGTDHDSTHVAGTTFVARDGATLGGDCRAVSLAESGTLRATFANARQGTLSVGSTGEQTLTRTEIEAGYPAPRSGANYILRGWYYNAGCHGQGVYVEVQGDTIFGLIFYYDATGRGEWAFFNGVLIRDLSNATSSFSGALNRCSRSTGSTVCPSIGTVTLQFPRNNMIVMTMPNGVVVTFTPFPI